MLKSVNLVSPTAQKDVGEAVLIPIRLAIGVERHHPVDDAAGQVSEVARLLLGGTDGSPGMLGGLIWSPANDSHDGCDCPVAHATVGF